MVLLSLCQPHQDSASSCAHTLRYEGEFHQNFTGFLHGFCQNIELEHLEKNDNHKSAFPLSRGVFSSPAPVSLPSSSSGPRAQQCSSLNSSSSSSSSRIVVVVVVVVVVVELLYCFPPEAHPRALEAGSEEAPRAGAVPEEPAIGNPKEDPDSKQRNPNPNKNTLIRKPCWKRIMESLVCRCFLSY